MMAGTKIQTMQEAVARLEAVAYEMAECRSKVGDLKIWMHLEAIEGDLWEIVLWMRKRAKKARPLTPLL